MYMEVGVCNGHESIHLLLVPGIMISEYSRQMNSMCTCVCACLRVVDSVIMQLYTSDLSKRPLLVVVCSFSPIKGCFGNVFELYM